MKEFIIFVCTDSAQIFFSKLRSAGLNYNLPGFSLNLTVRGVSNKHCLLTFFICFAIVGSSILAVLLAGYFAQRYLPPPKPKIVGIDLGKLCNIP